jgi:hypothetical protein
MYCVQGCIDWVRGVRNRAYFVFVGIYFLHTFTSTPRTNKLWKIFVLIILYHCVELINCFLVCICTILPDVSKLPFNPILS